MSRKKQALPKRECPICKRTISIMSNVRRNELRVHRCTPSSEPPIETSRKLSEVPEIPEVGDEIYVGTSLHLSRGSDDVLGGRAKVSRVTMGISAGNSTPFVSVEEHPGTLYNWEILRQEQGKLRERFGQERARPDPDDRPEFNRRD